jgi:hypothetical protein
MTTSLNIRSSLPVFALLATLAAAPLASQAVTTNYYTGFETTDDFTAGGTIWSNSSPWIGEIDSDNTYGLPSTGGNGILANHFPGMGQQAFVGQTSLGNDPSGSPWWILFMWPDGYGFDPVAVGRPIVKFSTTVSIEDSSNTIYDLFVWEAYNLDSARLFSLVFDNRYNAITYLPGTNGNVELDTGARYVNGVIYNLEITMNFASNVWSAALNGTQILAPVPMAATGVTPTFGDLDAIWLYSSDTPGNNYMVFDNYLITSESSAPLPPSRPSLKVVSAGSGSATTLRLTGQEGYQFAIDARTNLASSGTWTALGTNTVSGGFFDFVDSAASSMRARNYRARWVP